MGTSRRHHGPTSSMQRPPRPSGINTRTTDHLDHLITPDRDPAIIEGISAPITISLGCRYDQRYVDVLATHASSGSWQPIIATQPVRRNDQPRPRLRQRPALRWASCPPTITQSMPSSFNLNMETCACAQALKRRKKKPISNHWTPTSPTPKIRPAGTQQGSPFLRMVLESLENRQKNGL